MGTIEKAIERLANGKKRDVSHDTVEGRHNIDADGTGQAGSENSVEMEWSHARGLEKRQITLSADHLFAHGIITPDSKRGVIKDDFRHLKRPLILQMANDSASLNNENIVMITSAMPGEGKSFTATNLAMSLAMEKDKSVLLVDADVVNPSVNQLLGIEGKLGLNDYLLGEATDLSDLILTTNYEHFKVLPAGTAHEHSTELFSSSSMRNLLHELSSRYKDRVIVLDSPPLLVTTEAAVLAQMVGQVIMVVEAYKTPQEIVKRALKLLNPEAQISMVLNKCRFSPKKVSGYGYGYSDYSK